MKTPFAIILVVLATTLAGCSNAINTAELQAKIAELQAKVDAHEVERATTAKNLQTFDELDLVAFNNRDMALIKKIHAEDVKVYNPDGTITEPMAPHAEELQFLLSGIRYLPQRCRQVGSTGARVAGRDIPPSPA
jgi:outer membrane murein-binding lipoprotein Lpp